MPFEVNDIVQIDPSHDDRFGACLMIVSEPKSWGAQGYVKIPGGGDAYYRAPTSALVKVGRAEWVHATESDLSPA